MSEELDKFVMKAFIISMVNDHQSYVSTKRLLKTIEITKSRIQPFIVPATIPETIDFDISMHFPKEYGDKLYKNKQLNYTWPKAPVEDGLDISTGIYKRAYAAANWKKVAACSISHMRLWQHCIDIDEPILILEHDAFFVGQFKYKNIALSEKTKDEWTGGICGINSPFGTTRKASIFHVKLQQSISGSGKGIATVPYVDEPNDLPLPSGLPGNSAYIIKPWAAKKLLEKTLEVGIWPNDALMCRQFFPWLQHSTEYYTKVQGTPSTTTK